MGRNRALRLLDRLRDPGEERPAPEGASFVHVMPDGRVDLDAVNEQAALQCALSRLCAHCAESQGFPLVFAGPAAELEAGTCRRPGMHERCARAAVERYRDAGLVDVPWTLWASGSFTVERPHHREHHEQVRFRPGALLWSQDVHPEATAPRSG